MPRRPAIPAQLRAEIARKIDAGMREAIEGRLLSSEQVKRAMAVRQEQFKRRAR